MCLIHLYFIHLFIPHILMSSCMTHDNKLFLPQSNWRRIIAKENLHVETARKEILSQWDEGQKKKKKRKRKEITERSVKETKKKSPVSENRWLILIVSSTWRQARARKRKRERKKKTEETKIFFLWVYNQRKKNVRCSSSSQLRCVVLMYAKDVSLKTSRQDRQESELIDCY
jgi:hypothetical protein